VYVSFGTLLGHMSLAVDAYRAALRAVARIDARVLLTVGHQFDTSQLGELPGNVHVEPWVDQADVLGDADVVVCHGGSGTTFGALAAGVPAVVVPLFADQFANGAKVAQAGAGVVLDRGRDGEGRPRALSRGDAPRIAEAIQAVQAHSSYRQQAQVVAAEMAAAPSAEALLDDLITTL
jgi:MGT family glycosyltransferase